MSQREQRPANAIRETLHECITSFGVSASKAMQIVDYLFSEASGLEVHVVGDVERLRQLPLAASNLQAAIANEWKVRANAHERHMTERHRAVLRATASLRHVGDGHDPGESRCDDRCFERVTLCANCGSAWPCLELLAFTAATGPTSAQVNP